MKAVSLSLQIVAIIAAAASIYLWQDTRGKIASAEAHMTGVAGATLEEKAPKVPGLLKEIANQKTTVKNLQGRLSTLESRIQSTNSELESERRKSVDANAEIVKNRSQIRQLEASLATTKKRVAEKDSLIDIMKKNLMTEDVCSFCKHDTPCQGEKCDKYIEGRGMTFEKTGQNIDENWT